MERSYPPLAQDEDGTGLFRVSIDGDPIQIESDWDFAN